MSEVGIALENVDLFFGSNQVLRRVDLRIPQGAVCGLLGPSGCGKTTSVKVAAGILRASAGRAFVLGQPMPDLALMARIGYMAQSDALYLNLTAAENIEFFGALYGLRSRELRRRAEEVMDMVKLSADLKKPVRLYSGGMKRRLSLALAVLHHPPVLILDEPTVGIDPLLRQDIWLRLHEMAREGVTILVTTHVMDEAEKCDRLAMMREGLLLATGTPAEICALAGADSIERAFLRLSATRGETGAKAVTTASGGR
ncbi:MAG: ABC transporter ATP-binding protein [Gracilibacteraceae bacterium]|jgi:ABC-2 type transport system ATP-binding protein|nr:ABC transporter ATP-binding protein [Gracilibacteraceae bacterium]